MRALRLIGGAPDGPAGCQVRPLAGQAASAALGYATLRYLGELHLRDCVQVAKAAGLLLPAPGEDAPREQ